MKTLKKMASIVLVLAMIFSMAACGSSGTSGNGGSTTSEPEAKKSFKVGLCNFVDDASLNQICENIENTLNAAAAAGGFEIEILYDNCNANAMDMNQIIADFAAKEVDLMIGVATPVAMAMQGATEDSKTPVVFAAVSDPLSVGLVDSLAAPGANITGTSDYLDTNAIMNLILALNSETKKVGLLYDLGQDSSTSSIAAAKEFLSGKGIEIVEANGGNTQEIIMAAQSLIDAKVDAVFTPSDNTVMAAELSIYEALADAGIPHFAGADSFALNGAFLGYGVDYANLGVETANMVLDILVNGADPAKTAVKTFDNGTATINTEICDKLGYSFDDLKAKFDGLCTRVEEIKTAESF